MSSLKDLKDEIVRLLGLFLSLYYFLGFEEYFLMTLLSLVIFKEDAIINPVNNNMEGTSMFNFFSLLSSFRFSEWWEMR
ncbi:TPA: hypothetical protein ACGO2H_001825 [Streptococcus suis]